MKYATLQRCRMAGVAAFALSIVVIAGCGGGDSSGGSAAPPPPVVGAINGVVIQSLSPSTVPVGPGQIVTVTGSGFAAKDASGQRKFIGVKIGQVSANSTVVSDTTLTLVTPSFLAIGPADVRVVNTDGISAITAGDVLTFTGVSTGTTTGVTTGATTGTSTGTTTGVTTGTTTGTTTSGPPPPPTKTGR